MSGVVGLLDPTGVGLSDVRSAAAAAPYRGLPQLRSVGPLVLGVLTREAEAPCIVETSQSILAADARIDAALPDTTAAMYADEDAGLELLARVLDNAGPNGLDGLAADFAFARWDASRDELLLSRDAFGLRPLFWARQGARVGFASDPAVLVALGLVSGDLDFAVVARSLAGRDVAGERTAFAGISRVLGGRWLAFDSQGRVRGGRWFRPERVPIEATSLSKAATGLRDAIVAAVASRAQGERTVIQLSGGRDSASVAVAAQIAGVRATCFTRRLEPDSTPSEEMQARSLAQMLGYDWRLVHVGVEISRGDLEAIPDIAGSPLGFPMFPAALAQRDAVVGAKATLVLDGEGGDPLFAAHPTAVLDLVRSGRFSMGLAAARAFRNRWVYPYPVIAKTALRALAPRGMLTLRERLRKQAPWARSQVTIDLLTAPRSSREQLIQFLLYMGGSQYQELSTQFWQRAGVQTACPLYDQRVVRIALGLPVDLRVPLPGPKPVLAAALLEEVDESRVKGDISRYASSLTHVLIRDFPWLFESGNLCERYGFVRGGKMAGSDPERWQTELLNHVPVEMWLRRLEGV